LEMLTYALHVEIIMTMKSRESVWGGGGRCLPALSTKMGNLFPKSSGRSAIQHVIVFSVVAYTHFMYYIK